MGSVKVLGCVAAVAMFGAAASAADLPPIMPAVQVPVVEFSGWYLRGDIGMSNQKVGSLFNALYVGNTIRAVGHEFDAAPIFGIGVGYQWNSWFRLDVTGEYRGKANFKGIDVINNGAFVDDYRASKSEWLMLANFYADLGTWWCLTPFIGVGIGGSYNTISGFQDVNTPTGGVAFGPTASKWNFAWALHAGVAYKATPGLVVELAYRYVDLGDAITGDLATYQGANAVYNPMEFRHITSHDVRLGVRWLLQPEYVAPPVFPPLVSKG
jgi:opacity protein-like surface antigen